MITVRVRGKHNEAQLALLIAGETKGRVFVNYPIKNHTRKVRGKNIYKVTNGLV